jgi:hypothetical protein
MKHRTFATIAGGAYSQSRPSKRPEAHQPDSATLSRSRAEFRRLVAMQEQTMAELRKPLDHMRAQQEARAAELDALTAAFLGDEE